MSPSTPALKEQARGLLRRHELTNATLLWVLEEEEVEVVVDEEAGPTAVALLVLPRRGEWREPRFPGLRRLWLEAADVEGARVVLGRLPGEETFYGRIHRGWLEEVVAEAYRLEPVFELVYFRGDVRGLRPRGEFQVSFEEEPGPEGLALVEASGRTAEAARELVERCGGAFVARVAGMAVGVCCVNAKTEQVWEIRSVFVAEGARGRGVGQSLVSAAARAVLAQGRIPTYCTHDDNFPSQALVRSLGFEQYQRVRYGLLHPWGGGGR